MIKSKLDSLKKRLHIEIKEEILSTHVNRLQYEFGRILTQAPSEDWNTLFLDLRASRMVDSVGINWLFAETTRLRNLNKKFVIRISSPAIHRVMLFSGLDRLVTLKFRRRKQTR